MTSIYPALRYADAKAAIDWLGRAFGFERHQVHENPDGTIAHAELKLGDGMIMLGSAADAKQPKGSWTASIYVVVADPDAHCARATKAGAEIIRPLQDMDYGSREYMCRDLEGHIWSFGTYRPV